MSFKNYHPRKFKSGYENVVTAAKEGKKKAQKRLQNELGLKVADEKTLKQLNEDYRQGRLAGGPWLYS